MTKYVYDANDNITQKIEVLAGGGTRTSTYTYDILDHLLTSTEPQTSTANVVTTYTYDANERLTSKKVGNGAKTVYAYDGFGNVLTEKIVMDPANTALDITTTYTYDNNGRLSTKTDPLGNVTTYTYDGYDRVATEVLPDGTYKKYTYYKEGSVKTLEWYNSSNVIQTKSDMLYDGLGHIVQQKDYLSPSTSGGAKTTTYEYDTNFNVRYTTNPLGQKTTKNYDEFSRPVSVVDALGNTQTNTYDKRNLITVKTLTPSTGT